MRGANSLLLTVMPFATGTLPRPPRYTRLVAGSSRSSPFPCGACHQREILIPQSQTDRQFSRRLPTILSVPAELELAAGHQDVLVAFLQLGRQTKQERRVRVEVVRRGAAI